MAENPHQTWSNLANDAQHDASLAVERGRHRAALNRCYYSIFSHVAHSAKLGGYTPPVGWEGPHHDAVYQGRIVANHLRNWLDAEEQGRLIFIASLLYKLRIDADYHPSAEIGEQDVRLAFGRLLEGRRVLEAVR